MKQPYTLTVRTTQYIECYAESEEEAKEIAAERVVGYDVETIESVVGSRGTTEVKSVDELIVYLKKHDPRGEGLATPFGGTFKMAPHPEGEDRGGYVPWVTITKEIATYFDEYYGWGGRGGGALDEEDEYVDHGDPDREDFHSDG